ncbi:MAG: hypothetical protein ACTSWY_10130 [Promethearchaeota archaeon]
MMAIERGLNKRLNGIFLRPSVMFSEKFEDFSLSLSLEVIIVHSTKLIFNLNVT